MQYLYPCVLTPEAEGGYAVSFPDVAGALTCGDDRTEALAMAEDALVAALAGYVREQWDIPTPSSVGHGQEQVAVPPIAAAKLALYMAMRRQRITTAALAVRLGMNLPCAGSSIPTIARPSPTWNGRCAPSGVLWSSATGRTRDLSAPASEDHRAARVRLLPDRRRACRLPSMEG